MPGSLLYRDALAFAKDLLLSLEAGPTQGVLKERLTDHAIKLVLSVTQALAGGPEAPSRDDLTGQLRLLRTLLVLARDVGTLDEERFRALAQGLDRVANASHESA